MIREVQIEDAPTLLEIYNYYVKNTIVTFDLNELSLDEFILKMKDGMNHYPWFLIEFENKIIGYANASQWRKKPAYNGSVESTIYIHPKYHRMGFGAKLYKHLIQELTKRKFHMVVGGISLPNMGSVELHERLGFVKVGQFREAGYKFNKWIDVGFWELVL